MQYNQDPRYNMGGQPPQQMRNNSQGYQQQQQGYSQGYQQQQNYSQQGNNMKACKSCGQLIAKTAKICPHCGAKNKKPIYKRGWFIAICVIFVLSVIGSISGGKDSDDNLSNTTINSDNTNNQVDTNDTGNDIENNTEVEVAGHNRFNPGDTVDIDGFEVVYEKCEANWTGYSEYAAPDDGYKVIRSYFTFTNNSNGDRSCGSAYFSCYADGISCERFYFSTEDDLASLDTLSPGRKTKGWVYFEVPTDAQEIELEYGVEYFSSDHIIFEVK